MRDGINIKGTTQVYKRIIQACKGALERKGGCRSIAEETTSIVGHHRSIKADHSRISIKGT